MDAASQQLLESALQLPESERAELAARLIDSLDREADDNYHAAWSEEIKRRLVELDSGAVAAIPWPEARRLIEDDGDAPARN